MIGCAFKIAAIGKFHTIDALEAIVIHFFDGLETAGRADFHTWLQVTCIGISMFGGNKSSAGDTWIHAPDVLVIPCIRLFIVAIYKDHARLRRLPRRRAYQVPQVARADRPLHLALPGRSEE